MTVPWWDNPRALSEMDNGKPTLMPGGRQAALEALQGRIAGFVPEWRDLSDEDAGVALVRLFGLQLDAVLSRVEQLPDKALVEFLRVAGVGLAPARSARTLIMFTPEDAAVAPINVPEGARLASARADEEAGDVTWETDAPATVQPMALEERQVSDGEVAQIIAADEAFDLLGARPEVGAALYLGFLASGEVSGTVSLGFEFEVAGRLDPVAAGLAPARPLPTVQLRWEALTATGFEEAELVADDTDGFTQSGVVELDLPRGMVADRLDVLGEGDRLHWIRLRIAGGTFLPGPRVAAIHPNVVRATAKTTWRDEFPVLETGDGGARAQLARTPVLSGSVILEIDEGVGGGSLFDLEENAPPTGEDGIFRRWLEVATLAGQTPDARVFTLDGASGVIQFGDGTEGRAPPPGIRGVAVRSYAVTQGAAGNVAVGEVSRMPVRLLEIAEVTNPMLAIGGADEQDRTAAIANGPRLLKARGRAVSAGDMAVLARYVEGANVRRAWVSGGIDPTLDAASRAGAVAIYVLPHRHPSDDGGEPPMPDGQTLKAVAAHIANAIGPLGARIVAAAPRFHDIRVEALLTVQSGGDAAAAEAAVRTAIDDWLSPETGDWDIGATVRNADLSQVILNAHHEIISAPFLAVSRDGIAYDACEDVPLAVDGLPWPRRHRLATEIQEASA